MRASRRRRLPAAARVRRAHSRRPDLYRRNGVRRQRQGFRPPRLRFLKLRRRLQLPRLPWRLSRLLRCLRHSSRLCLHRPPQAFRPQPLLRLPRQPPRRRHRSRGSACGQRGTSHPSSQACRLCLRLLRRRRTGSPRSRCRVSWAVSSPRAIPCTHPYGTSRWRRRRR